MIGTPSRFSSRARSAKVIHALAPDDVVRFGEHAEQGDAAIADVIPAGAVVEEAHHLEAELAMLEDLVGDDASEVAGARDQNTLQPDPGAPPPLEGLSHQLARRVRQADIDDQEDHPDVLGDFVEADVLRGFVGVVGLVIQGAAESEHDREDRPHEDPEKIIDARSTAAQPIQPLHLERDRNQHADERRDAQILRERRKALVDRQQAGERLEPQQVRDEERRDAEHHVGGDEEGHEQPVIPAHHCSFSRAAGLRRRCAYLAAVVRPSG